MLLAQSTPQAIAEILRGPGLELDLGIVRVRVRSTLAALADTMRRVYGAFTLIPAFGFYDLSVNLDALRGWRQLLRPQINFYLEGDSPFEPFAAQTHLPMLEWGLNWSIAHRFTDRLLLHAGVVERNGQAIILPALPGSGKSTLTAALVQRGYRLLSDEFGAVAGDNAQLLPVVRPIALKNESIDVIRSFAPQAILGPSFPNTRKGTVAHMAPDAICVAQCHVAAQARLIVFPQYNATSATELEAMPKARAFAKLSVNAFNYDLRGAAGFAAVAALIDASDCYRLRYSDLNDAIARLSALLDAPVDRHPG